MKWIDSIMFNGEEIIKLRLEYMFEYIDKFYITEQRYTHQKEKKEKLFFEKYSEWFEPYKSKIGFLVDEMLYEGNTWEQETNHRRYAASFILDDFQNDEYILTVCDCDEIPDVSVILENKNNIYNTTNTGCVIMNQKLFYYNLDWYIGPWNRAFILNNNSLNNFFDIQIFREKSGYINKVINCGWHLSYFLSIDDIIRKLNSFAHNEYNLDKYKQKKYISDCIKNGVDLFQRSEWYKDSKFEKYLQDDFPECFKKFSMHIKSLQFF